MGRAHGIQRAVDGLQLGAQQLVAPGVETRHPFVGQRLAGARFDQRGLAAHGAADEVAHAFVDRHVPAAFGQLVAQHAVGDGLAVDQHAVAVEQDRFKIHSYLRSSGRRCRPKSFKNTIDVEPAPALAHEAAALVQAHGAAGDAVAGDEFDLGGVVAGRTG